MPHRPARKSSRCAGVPALLAAVAAAFLTLSPVSAQSATPTSGLLVHGSGTAYGNPDLAVLTLGVEAVQPQVQAALSQADQVMSAVRGVFVAGGVDPEDIRTAAFDVFREEIRDRNGNVTGERYHVVHSYRVTVRDMGAVGKLLAGAVQAGANNVQSVRFGLSDPAALQQQARREAMHDAEARARQLASLAGVTLGRPVSIEESTSSVSPPTPMASVRAAGGGVPVEGGQLAVEVQVTVWYAMQ